MSVIIRLPPVLRAASGGRTEIASEGETLLDAITALAAAEPRLALHLFDEHRRIRRNIVFVHGDELIRAHEAASCHLKAGDAVTLTNALAGG